MLFELIPSTGKEKGWEAYSQSRPYLLEQRLNTADLLPKLHGIATGHYGVDAKGLPTTVLAELEALLMVQDRPDAPELMAEIDRRTRERIPNVNELPPEQAETELLSIYREVCAPTTQIRLDPRISGALRFYGTRRINNGPEETIFSNHTCVFRNSVSDLGLVPPNVYYGLSAGLLEVYQKLCRTFDDMRSRATTLDEVLMAETFLQLWGTRVIHPFWDANGRAFSYHMVLTLDREGIHIPDFQYLETIIREVTPRNEAFLFDVLRKAQLGLIPADRHTVMTFDHNTRSRYHAQLRQAIESGMEQGINSNDPFSMHYFDFAEILGKHAANLQGRRYEKTHFPKEDWLERTRRENPERLGFYHNITGDITAIGIKDEKGEPAIRIELKDLRLDGTQQLIVEASNRLRQMWQNVSKTAYGTVYSVYSNWTAQHSIVNKYLGDYPRIGAVAIALSSFTTKQRIQNAAGQTSERLIQESGSLLKQLSGEESILINRIFEAKANGIPITSLEEELRRSEELLQASASFLKRAQLLTSEQVSLRLG